MSNLRFKYKIWLETEDGVNVFGDGKYELLKAIDEYGSLKLAIEKMGLSYRKTWDNLKKIESVLGYPLIDTTRGGKEGGASELTDAAHELLSSFENIHKQVEPVFRKAREDRER